MKSSGFLLLSSCIYLICLSLLIIITMRIIGHSMITVQALYKEMHKSMDMHMITDLLLRDLWVAPSTIKCWYVHTNKALVWQQKAYAVGWYITDDGIKRMQGDYNPTSQTWLQNAQSLIVPGTKMYFTHEHTQEKMWSITAIPENDIARAMIWSFYER